MVRRLFQGAAVSILGFAAKRVWGFRPRLVEQLVIARGPAKALWFAARNMGSYELTRLFLRPMRTHLACLTVSIHNGCRNCTFGHAYAIELLYFRRYGKLFPVEASTMVEWIGLPPAELRHHLVDALERADLHGEVIWVDRTIQMAGRQVSPVSRDEARIDNLVRVFNALNEIGRGLDPDEAHDQVNRDTRLKARHTELRRYSHS